MSYKNMGYRKTFKKHEIQGNIKKEIYEVSEPICWMIYVVKWSDFRVLGGNQGGKYGDFEAQRHWMEITLHLPIKEWYFYDLEWWGLDYPPLSAYLSYIYGKIGNLIEPSWFALDTSRGLQTEDLKFYMRMTVIVSDFIIYFPAVIRFSRYWKRLEKGSALNTYSSIALILLQPALILIDHGHFQYNNVMLGLVLLSLCYFINDRYILGSIFFVSSICFKQMSLYYSPLVFFYLLGLCIKPQLNICRFIYISIATVSTFALIFFPLYIYSGYNGILQCIHRLFPFQRGLWEDKVANAWCVLNTIINSSIATLISILPPCLIIFLKPKIYLLPWGLTCSAFGFYLFSYQVHEKSILLPLMPATILLLTLNKNAKAWIGWINIIATFSMWPLLKKDGLELQYTVLQIYWLWLGGFMFFPLNKFEKFIHKASYAILIIIHILDAFVTPPLHHPHLWILLNMQLSFTCFGIFWLWSLWKLWLKSGIWTSIKIKQK
ncbi:hypothetical protein T552_01265 [Pneumocystis carinii B80]|uniref:Alpha-1,3-glucosyltransferase n=1 Tax=Pneumocystis carinii (strain B80) TaxID=1408658 RepID=A0A0W4ZLQ0_PNEC8|nr:hypothetical protein T552_01265 [Pneumocystis carinii B80]KTW29310.1 hypothetical protein T552_01265 [Pneumocystis carinii B80]